MNKKQSSISKRIILILTIITLIIPTNISAKKDYDKLENTSDVLQNCTPSTCTPLCVYTSKSGTKVGYIGYYFNMDVNGKKGFEINALGLSMRNIESNGDLEKKAKTVYSFTDPSGKIPTSSIYWSNIEGKAWDKATNPEKKIGYFLLDESLECPNYMSIDTDSYVELCFSDKKNTCEEQNNMETKFRNEDGYELSYSFIDELKKIIDKAYNDNYVFESVIEAEISSPGEYPTGPEGMEKLEMKKVEFIYDMDPEMIINIEENAEKNATRYCEYLKENMQKENIETYMEKLKKEQVVKFEEKFNTSLKLYSSSDQYKSSYTSQPFYENNQNILNILKDRKIKDNNERNYYDKIDSMYVESYENSMKYFEEKCKYLKDIDIEYEKNSEKLKEKVRENYETVVYSEIGIDVTKELTCGDISELADLIKTGYFIIEVISIIILIGLSSLDYAKVILNGEQDEIKKCNKKLLTRLIITVIIFLLPGLINFTLKIFKIEGFNSETPLCVEISSK